jgi:hypothetical protein
MVRQFSQGFFVAEPPILCLVIVCQNGGTNQINKMMKTKDDFMAMGSGLLRPFAKVLQSGET